MSDTPPDDDSSLKSSLQGDGTRERNERIFRVLALLAVLLPLGVLVLLIIDVARDGIVRLSLDFLTSMPSRHADEAGIWPAIVGSLWLIGLTAALALPVGVGAALYLEEYADTHNKWLQRLNRVLEVNIANLAGVPSVVYGLLGLAVFVRFVGLERSVLSGACTLALLVLPIVIISSREALRTVPQALRQAGYGLGATRWQVTARIVLPMALPGILTGAILSVSRALGETAPLVVVGALTYVTFLPDGPSSPYTALPIQIYNWVSRPQEEFAINAAAGIIVLLATMLLLNTIAIIIRHRFQTRT